MKRDLVKERSENGETNVLFFKLKHARRVCNKKWIFSPRDGGQDYAKLMKILYFSWPGLTCVVWDVRCSETFTNKGCLLKDEFPTRIEVGVVAKEIKRSQTNGLHFEIFKNQFC